MVRHELMLDRSTHSACMRSAATSVMAAAADSGGGAATHQPRPPAWVPGTWRWRTPLSPAGDKQTTGADVNKLGCSSSWGPAQKKPPAALQRCFLFQAGPVTTGSSQTRACTHTHTPSLPLTPLMPPPPTPTPTAPQQPPPGRLTAGAHPRSHPGSASSRHQTRASSGGWRPATGSLPACLYLQGGDQGDWVG